MSSGNSNIQVETRISSGNSNINCILKKGDFHGMYFPEGLIEYQVESRIFKWKLEYQVETRIFKWKLEYSSGISNIQVETRISSVLH